MSKQYLDTVVYNSKTEGQNITLTLRDVEGRALIQDNINNIATLTAKEQQDRNDINTNTEKNTEQDNRLTEIDTKNTEQDTHISTLETSVAEHTTEIQALDDRVTTTEDDIAAIKTKNTEQDNRLAAIETKNTEQDTHISTLETTVNNHETRITAAETEIQALDDRVTTTEDDITKINEKDAEQDKHLTELDDRVAASTYEAGIGIYFGQGVKHTNINVEEEVLDQINQNTIDIDDLKKREVGTILAKGDTKYKQLELTGDENGGLYVYTESGKETLGYRAYNIFAHYTEGPDTITLDESFIDYFKNFFYSVDAVNGPLVLRLTNKDELQRSADIVVPCIMSYYDASPIYPVTITGYFTGWGTAESSNTDYRITIVVPAVDSTYTDVQVDVTALTSDIKTQVQTNTNNITTLNNKYDTVNDTVTQNTTNIEDLQKYIPDPYNAAQSTAFPTNPGVYKISKNIGGTVFPGMLTITRYREADKKYEYTFDTFGAVEIGTSHRLARVGGSSAEPSAVDYPDTGKLTLTYGYVRLEEGPVDLKELPYGNTLIYAWENPITINHGPVTSLTKTQSMLVTVSPMLSQSAVPTVSGAPYMTAVICSNEDSTTNRVMYVNTATSRGSTGDLDDKYTWKQVQTIT